MPDRYMHVDFVLTDGTSTQRARELITSAARSHASRVSHMKRPRTARRHRMGRQRTQQEEEEESKFQTENEHATWIRKLQSGNSGLSPGLDYVPYTVNYYVNHIIPNIRTVFDVFQVKNFWDDHWLRCLSKEPYYSAFSAYLQMIRDSSADPQLRTPSTPLIRHKLNAIQFLRRQLANGTHVDDVSLLGIIQLGFVEAQTDDCTRYDLHRHALSRLVQDQSGVEVMSSCVAPLVSAYDLYRSFQAASPLRLEPKVFGPTVLGDITTEIVSQLVEDLPSGFQVLARNGKLPLELIRALHRTTKILRKDHQQPQFSTYDPHGRVNNNLSQPGLHVEWWTACPSLLAQPVREFEEPEIGNLLSMGLWLYVALEFSSDSIFETFQHWISVARWLRHDLTEKLARCVMIRSDDEERCLKWLTRLVIECWRGPDQILLPLGSRMNWFRKRRFAWPRDPDEGFFAFTKGSDLD